MLRKSHFAMGQMLLHDYLGSLSPLKARLFLLGCVQPDWNPTTYLKGSLRCRSLRGHNFDNALPFLLRLANRLERKTTLSCWDCYSMGKLIHYLMDAFTAPHNVHFENRLLAHREYEIRLQSLFLTMLETSRAFPDPCWQSAADLILTAHKDYLQLPCCAEHDCGYTLSVCPAVMQKLTENVPECQEFQFPSQKKDAIL